MSWITVYIRGRNGFQDAVISRLKRTWLLGSPEPIDDLVMFWLPDLASIMNLKIAVGSELILKYRLHFITDPNIHLKLTKGLSTLFSDSENEMVKKMMRWENAQLNGNIHTLAVAKN